MDDARKAIAACNAAVGELLQKKRATKRIRDEFGQYIGEGEFHLWELNEFDRCRELKAIIRQSAKPIAAVLISGGRDPDCLFELDPDRAYVPSDMETLLQIRKMLGIAEALAESALPSVDEAAGRGPAIPTRHRTKPLSYKKAAKLMGKGDSRDAAEWLSKCVADGTVKAEHRSRQTHVFDKRDFPAAAHNLL